MEDQIMKRTLCVLLAALMMLSVAACGQQNTPQPAPADQTPSGVVYGASAPTGLPAASRNVNDSGTIGGVAVNNSHATHIGGIIAARTGNGSGVAGLAHGATLMPVKVSNGGAMWMSTVATAVHYATANGATVISMSLTSSPPRARSS